MNEISTWMEEVTQRDHPLFHPVQVGLMGSISWIGARLFSIPPTNAVVVSILAYAINQVIAPIIGKYIEPYQEISLVPFCGQITHLALSFGSSNLLCHLVGKSLAIGDAVILGTFFLTAIAIARVALANFSA